MHKRAEERLHGEGERTLQLLPREAVESPCLETPKTCLDANLCNLVYGACFGKKVGLDRLERSLPAPTIL